MFSEALDNQWRSIGFGLVTGLFALVFVAIPVAGGGFVTFSAAVRRQFGLLAVQAILTVAIVGWYSTPAYRDHTLGVVVPLGLFLVQLALRRRFGSPQHRA